MKKTLEVEAESFRHKKNWGRYGGVRYGGNILGYLICAAYGKRATRRFGFGEQKEHISEELGRSRIKESVERVEPQNSQST